MDLRNPKQKMSLVATPIYDSMYIAVDFDGTIFKHEYPAIGEEVPMAIDMIKRLQAKGHKIILYTMRHGEMLTAAIEACRARGVEFWSHNHNPEQASFSLSPKIWANIYIDDAALGCPLFYPPSNERPWVNWSGVFDLLAERGYFNEPEYQGQ